jgi:hypothetical protein
MWDGFGTTSEPHLRAEIIPALLAGSAAVAWYSDLQSNAVTYGKPGDALSDSFNYTCRFMA